MLAISKRYQIGIKTFFRLTMSLTESFVFWFIMNSYFYACPAFSVEVKNTPGTTKVLGSNMT